MSRSAVLTIAVLAFATVGCASEAEKAAGEIARAVFFAGLASKAAREATEAAASARIVAELSRGMIADYQAHLKSAWEKQKAVLEALRATRAKWQSTAILLNIKKDRLANAERLQATAEQAAEDASKAEVAARLIAEGAKADSATEAAQHAAAAGNAAIQAAEAAEIAKAAANKAATLSIQTDESVTAALKAATSGAKPPDARPD